MPNVSTKVIAMDERRNGTLAARGECRDWNVGEGVGDTALTMAVARWNEADARQPPRRERI